MNHLRGTGPESGIERFSGITPRQSVGADFGGNNSFFDAVGVMRMDAIIRGPDVSKTKTGKAGKDDQEEEAQGHHRKSSSGSSFHGPPDIARTRPLRRVPQNLRAERGVKDEPFVGF